MICTATNKSADLFQQAMESLENTLSAAMELHEDTLRRSTAILRDAGSPLEWERTVPGRVNEAIVALQRHVDESIGFMNENAQQTVELMGTGRQMHAMDMDYDAGEEDGGFWSHALTAMYNSEQIIRQANARVSASWRELTAQASQRTDFLR